MFGLMTESVKIGMLFISRSIGISSRVSTRFAYLWVMNAGSSMIKLLIYFEKVVKINEYLE